MFLKILTLVALIGASLNLFANTQAIIAKGNSKGTVVIIGSPSDHEAWRFYETLAVEVKEMDGKYTKVWLFDNAAGERVLSASCVFSKLVKENGTCTITVFPVMGANIDGGQGSILYTAPNASEAAAFAAGFEPADAQGLVFANDNGRFRIDAELGPKGEVLSISLRYQ